MEVSKFLILQLLLVAIFSSYTVNSMPQQQQQQHPQLVNQQPQAVNIQQSVPDSVISVPLDSAETPVTNHYPYQSNGLSPTTGYHQPYSGSSYGNRDVYNNNNNGGWTSPYFGVTTGTAWELSAYFGPVFWAFIAIIGTFGFCVGISRFIFGWDIFGGMFQRIKESAPSGKSLDLNKLTNTVYQALDAYEKFVAKDAISASSTGVKR